MKYEIKKEVKISVKNKNLILEKGDQIKIFTEDSWIAVRNIIIKYVNELVQQGNDPEGIGWKLGTVIQIGAESLSDWPDSEPSVFMGTINKLRDINSSVR